MDKEVLVGSGESRAGRSGGEHLTPWPGGRCASQGPSASECLVSRSAPRTTSGGRGGRLCNHESDRDSSGRASALGAPNGLISQMRVDSESPRYRPWWGEESGAAGTDPGPASSGPVLALPPQLPPPLAIRRRYKCEPLIGREGEESDDNFPFISTVHYHSAPKCCIFLFSIQRAAHQSKKIKVCF